MEPPCKQDGSASLENRVRKGFYTDMKVIKWLDKNFECVILVVILVLMTAIMSAQVICRKFFGISLPWAEPFCCHMMIYMGLLGISCTLAEGSAIRFDVIVNFVSEQAKLVFSLIADIVTFVTFVFLTPSTFQVIGEMTGRAVPGLPYNMSLVYSICAFSIVVIDFRSFEQVVKTILALMGPKKAKIAAEGREEV